MQQVFDINDVAGSHRTVEKRSLRKSRAWPYLSEADRTMIELSEQGLSCRLIGRAVGVNAGTVCRRLALVRARLASPLARFALDPHSRLPESARTISLHYAVTGLRPAVIARSLNLAPPVVRDQLHFAQGVLLGATRR